MKIWQLLLFSAWVHFSTQDQYKRKPEQGVFHFPLSNKAQVAYTSKTLYAGSKIGISILTFPKVECMNTTSNFTFRWVVIGSHCKGELSHANSNPNATILNCLRYPMLCPLHSAGEYIESKISIACGETVHFDVVKEWQPLANKPTKVEPTSVAITTTKSAQSRRRRSEVPPSSTPSTTVKPHTLKVSQKPMTTMKTTTAVALVEPFTALANTTFMGEYLVIVEIVEDIEPGEASDQKSKDKTWYFETTVKLRGPAGYLSAHEYPLLIFYMVMCIVYVFYAAAWLLMSACNYRDLLRVQFWICGVILLGLAEKAVHYSEYSTVNSTGVSAIGTEKLAEVISAFKRAVSRMLVVVVSLGFGIVKPRLGPMLPRVIGVGLLYFIVAILEAMIRIDVYFDAKRSAWVFMFIPLAIIDSVICWWVFMSLLQTMKTLRLRRNTVKLSLYRHFANTIVFCVLVSLGMVLWSIYYHEQECVEDFSNEWFDTACWPILFSVVLLVIMILWRPNTNNQRYAYSPMIDGNDSDLEDMEEPMLGSGATENMKMRSTNKKTYYKTSGDKTADDLKWIEENIPQSVADAALPALIDSDEEVIMIKHEMNKME